MEYLSSGGSLLLAILGLGFVIFIHELGHFAFAKWAKVKVEEFAIGFGKVLWARPIGETRYTLRLLPLGGFVRMKGQEDLPGGHETDDDPRSFANKHPAWRAAILLGGVLFNLISSYLILLGLAWTALPYKPPVIDAVQPKLVTSRDGVEMQVESPAQKLGLHRGDRIVSFNGDRVYSQDDLMLGTLTADTIELEVIRDGERIRLPPEGADPVEPVYDIRRGGQALGIVGPKSRRIYLVGGDGGEDLHRRLVGAEVVAVAGERLDDASGTDVERALEAHIGEEVVLTVIGNHGEEEVRIRYAGDPSNHFGSSTGLPMQVDRLVAGGAAEEAGILPGDVVHRIDGEVPGGTGELAAMVQEKPGEELRIAIHRWDEGGWKPREIVLVPRWDEAQRRWLIGIVHSYLQSGPLPPTFEPDDDSHPLAAAGLVPGDVALPPGTGTDGERAADTHLRFEGLRDGQIHRAALSEKAKTRLADVDRPGTWARLFGAEVTKSLRTHLIGTTVAATNDGLGVPEPGMIMVEGPEGDRRIVDLSALPSGDRATILAMEPGDRIVSLHNPAADGGILLEYLRGGQGESVEVRVKPRKVGTSLAFGLPQTKVHELESWTEAFTLANHTSVQMIEKTLAIIPRFFQSAESGGLDSDKALAGPLGIFGLLKTASQEHGFATYLQLIALIGLNLFLINLLPIPITDGGQLVFLGIEVVIRRPVPVVIQNVAMLLGVALVVLLFLYVTGLDLARFLL